uniref:Uncharacterized protein n=1 Tax=Siphoviridae sp. ctwWa4 TaxID=2826517 RepID=A0A8S5NC65_9CAUD|nr:MAG TPA: hypothetical protein [Siphoviridae sp. ctwWa4]
MKTSIATKHYLYMQVQKCNLTNRTSVLIIKSSLR